MGLSITRKTIRQSAASLHIPATCKLTDLIAIINQVIGLNNQGFSLQNDPFQKLFGATLEFTKQETLEEDREGLTTDEERRLREYGDRGFKSSDRDSEMKGLTAFLKKNGIETMGDLAKHAEDEIRHIKGMGKARFKEVKRLLSSYHLRFGMGELSPPSGDTRPAEATDSNLDRSVEQLELSVRTYNCLKNANIQTTRELVQKTEQELLRSKNFGRKSLNEIKEVLSNMGLSLGMKLN